MKKVIKKVIVAGRLVLVELAAFFPACHPLYNPVSILSLQ